MTRTHACLIGLASAGALLITTDVALAELTPRQYERFDRSLGDVRLIASVDGYAYHDESGSVCGAAGGCLHFADPSLGTYAPGGRFVASVTTRPIYVERDANLYLRHALATEDLAPYDEARVAIRCGAETVWRTLYRKHYSFPLIEAVIGLTASDRGKLCQFQFTFDSGDAINNSYAGWRIHSVGLLLPQSADPDADGIANASDNCPHAYNPDQAPWGRVGAACALRLRGGLVDGVAGVPHTQSLVLPGGPIATYTVTGPAEMSADPYGKWAGTPAAGSSVPVHIEAYAGPDYDVSGTYTFRVHSAPLDALLRAMLIVRVTQPYEEPFEGYDFATLTRYDQDVAVVFAPGVGENPDGSIQPGRELISQLIDTYVPLLTAGRGFAYFASAPPTDGRPYLLVDVTTGGAQGGFTAEHERRIDTRTGSFVTFGEGRIEYGEIWFPASWFADPANVRVTSVAHELGHAFNGTHSWLLGAGFVQQRFRRHRLPMGSYGTPEYEIDETEFFIYDMVYRMPIGTSSTDLIDAGLVQIEDYFPPPQIDAVMGTHPTGTGSWVWDSDDPVRPGSRITIFGAHFGSPWTCSPVDTFVRYWDYPEVIVPGVAGPIPAIDTNWQGDGCQLIQIELPATTVSGPITVRTHELDTGTVRESEPFWLELDP